MKEVSEPTKYHCTRSCNKCCGVNEVTNSSYDGSVVCEAETKCTTCGHKDYWAYGFFESSIDMESNCKTYSFKH